MPASPHRFRDALPPSGEYYLDIEDGTVRWTPFWYETNPVVESDSGASTRLTYEYTSTDHVELASTILHELGHTLGLCHTENPSCQEQLSPEDRSRPEESTMYTSSDRTLNYLSSEWQRVQRYLTCPPSDPLKSIAEGASSQAIVDAKYGYLLDEMLSVDSRDCGNFRDVPDTLTPAENPSVYEPSFNVSGEPLEPPVHQL